MKYRLNQDEEKLLRARISIIMSYPSCNLCRMAHEAEDKGLLIDSTNGYINICQKCLDTFIEVLKENSALIKKYSKLKPVPLTNNIKEVKVKTLNLSSDQLKNKINKSSKKAQEAISDVALNELADGITADLFNVVMDELFDF